MASAYTELYEAATALVAALDKSADKLLPQEIVDVVKLHAKLAVGSAWVPVPGADIAAGAANIWGMYIRIKNKVEIPARENIIKTVGTGVATNLVSYIAMVGAASALKMIPGIGTMGGAIIMSASLYAVTLAGGYIYVKALTALANKGNGVIDFSQLEAAVKEILNSKEIIKNFINAAKKDYKVNKSEIDNIQSSKE